MKGEQDYSGPYQQYLPIALRTAKSVDRDGGAPFHLRAHETKKVPVFRGQDGWGKDLQINCEGGGASDLFSRITFLSAADMRITIYGAPNPPSVDIHLRSENEILKTTFLVLK